MLNKYKVVTEIDNINEKMFELFRKFDDSNFNKKEYQVGWSAGDLAEHLLLLDKKMIQILDGEKEPTKRDPEEKIEWLKSVFLNIENKRTAPEHLTPSNVDKDFKEILTELTQTRQELINIAGTRDLTLLCVNYEHKTFGMLTVAELIYLIIYHTERHIIQLNRILAENLIVDAE